ncbi:hypothetical protein [Streptomyces sp. S465]|uniref:hypothetical protein n=1 Tax=Streptomyces sp. S465 TaxID=2979468 RepID=UPI0022A83B82|nr:hypothetical protein [Streptomyces sp. S465]WAP55032.1 hypothetical protein N6H00_08540 [Streptomyces sp. S465]
MATSAESLAHEMTRYWGAFTKTGRRAAGQMVWPGYHSGKGLMLSLRAGAEVP